jgi:predicted component of type VI protein secretion system
MLPNSKEIPGNPTNVTIHDSTEQKLAENGFINKIDIFD